MVRLRKYNAALEQEATKLIRYGMKVGKEGLKKHKRGHGCNTQNIQL